MIGGTEKFKNAKGFAELRLLFPTGQVSIDGAKTLLKITVDNGEWEDGVRMGAM
ncbi:hypothetical protein JHK87_027876 [Glycine soja]|nr:hypothetical protein JHK87_027876 [Glycine soja]